MVADPPLETAAAVLELMEAVHLAAHTAAGAAAAAAWGRQWT
jgi:hypothetical protein